MQKYTILQCNIYGLGWLISPQPDNVLLQCEKDVSMVMSTLGTEMSFRSGIKNRDAKIG